MYRQCLRFFICIDSRSCFPYIFARIVLHNCTTDFDVVFTITFLILFFTLRIYYIEGLRSLDIIIFKLLYYKEIHKVFFQAERSRVGRPLKLCNKLVVQASITKHSIAISTTKLIHQADQF